jgi:hypothetical protein
MHHHTERAAITTTTPEQHKASGAFLDECGKIFAALAAAPAAERAGHIAALQNLFSATASAGIVPIFRIRYQKAHLKTLLDGLAAADQKPTAQSSTGLKS